MGDRVLLLEIRVTAQRVQRFARDVELNGSSESRDLWRASLDDLRVAIRQARAAGLNTEDIQHAALDTGTGRFTRPPAADREAVGS